MRHRDPSPRPHAGRHRPRPDRLHRLGRSVEPVAHWRRSRQRPPCLDGRGVMPAAGRCLTGPKIASPGLRRAGCLATGLTAGRRATADCGAATPVGTASGRRRSGPPRPEEASRRRTGAPVLASRVVGDVREPRPVRPAGGEVPPHRAVVDRWPGFGVPAAAPSPAEGAPPAVVPADPPGGPPGRRLTAARASSGRKRCPDSGSSRCTSDRAWARLRLGRPGHPARHRHRHRHRHRSGAAAAAGSRTSGYITSPAGSPAADTPQPSTAS